MARTNKKKMYKNKRKTHKNKTHKNKTHKNKNKKTTRHTLRQRKHKIGGTTPPSKRRALGIGPTPIIQLPPCRYGTECTRKNPQHKREESHPCKYGSQCYNDDDEHRAMFTHEEDEFKEELKKMHELFLIDAPTIIPPGSKIIPKLYRKVSKITGKVWEKYQKLREKYGKSIKN